MCRILSKYQFVVHDQIEKESQVHEDLRDVEEVKREAEQQQQEYLNKLKRLQDDLASLQVS